jgi:hypothetical protein
MTVGRCRQPVARHRQYDVGGVFVVDDLELHAEQVAQRIGCSESDVRRRRCLP